MSWLTIKKKQKSKLKYVSLHGVVLHGSQVCRSKYEWKYHNLDDLAFSELLHREEGLHQFLCCVTASNDHPYKGDLAPVFHTIEEKCEYWSCTAESSFLHRDNVLLNRKWLVRGSTSQIWLFSLLTAFKVTTGSISVHCDHRRWRATTDKLLMFHQVAY